MQSNTGLIVLDKIRVKAPCLLLLTKEADDGGKSDSIRFRW